MKPILYSTLETEFTSAGIAILSDCIECIVTEELGGVYELSMVYPVDGRHFDLIEEGKIIGASHDDNGDVQPFEIYKSSLPIDGKVTYSAHHISYRLNTAVYIPQVTAIATDLEEAFEYIKEYAVDVENFTFETDITPSEEYQDYAFREVVPVRKLFTDSPSMLDSFGGGEVTYDKYKVVVQGRRGRDTGIQIRYGKNLTDLNQDVDISEMYNAVAPFYSLQAEQNILLPEGYVAHGSPEVLRIVPLDLTNEFNKKPSEVSLRNKAIEKLEASFAWVENKSITVSFAALWQTAEYEQYAELQKVVLGDSVSVYYPKFNVIANNQRVVKTEYDTLRERYTEITLNELPATLWDTNAEQIKSEVEAQASSLNIKHSNKGNVTTDANGTADISELVVNGGVPVSGEVEGQEAYVRIGSNGDGTYKAFVIDSSGNAIRNTALSLIIYSIR